MLGTIKETCYYCVPSFKVLDDQQQEVYLMHPPTCCGGMCVNCATEGNPCRKGCCKVPFWIFPPKSGNTNGRAGESAEVGKIVKVPKSFRTELFTDANAFEIIFPESASSEQKAVLTGSAILIDSIFFEGD